MRILFVNHVSYVSGAENSLLHLVRGLDVANYECYAMCPPGGPLVDAFKALGVAVNTVEMGKHPLQFARGIQAIICEIHQHRIDLVHANSIDAIQYCALAARLTHTPLVGHVRNIVTFRWRGIWLVKQADKLIAVSEATRRSLIDQGVPNDRVEVIYNGIAVDRFQPAPGNRSVSRRTFALPDNAPLVGSVGRLHPVKGYADFVQAARFVLDEIPEAHFAIAGSEPKPDGHYRHELVNLTQQLDVADRVHFIGEVDQVELFLQGLDVFVLPSLQEPFARAILEAMGCGCPIVATAVGGTPEAIEDGYSGLLVSPAQPREMALAIMRLLLDRELASRLGYAARKGVVTDFSVASNIERTQCVYQRLLAAQR